MFEPIPFSSSAGGNEPVIIQRGTLAMGWPAQRSSTQILNPPSGPPNPNPQLIVPRTALCPGQKHPTGCRERSAWAVHLKVRGSDTWNISPLHLWSEQRRQSPFVIFLWCGAAVLDNVAPPPSPFTSPPRRGASALFAFASLFPFCLSYSHFFCDTLYAFVLGKKKKKKRQKAVANPNFFQTVTQKCGALGSLFQAAKQNAARFHTIQGNTRLLALMVN